MYLRSVKQDWREFGSELDKYFRSPYRYMREWFAFNNKDNLRPIFKQPLTFVLLSPMALLFSYCYVGGQFNRDVFYEAFLPDWFPDGDTLKEWAVFDTHKWELGFSFKWSIFTHFLYDENDVRVGANFLGGILLTRICTTFRSVMKARLVTPAFLAVFLGGTAFGAFVWLKDPKRESDTYLMGAAAGTCSLLGCAMALHPAAGVVLDMSPPIRLVHVFVLLSGWDLYSYFTQEKSTIPHGSHLGGMAFGVLFGLLLRRFLPRQAIASTITRKSAVHPRV